MAQAAARTGLTPEEYLAFERASEVKHEYLGGEIFAMSGGTSQHNLLVLNLASELRQALRQGPCLVYPSDMRVRAEAGESYFYPDVSVVCEPPRFEDPRRDVLLNPQVVCEVLSDSTESFDRGEKFARYRRLESLSDYVLVSQKQVLVEHFSRRPDGTWLLTVLGPGEILVLASVGCEVAVDEIYLKVFEVPAAADEPAAS